MSNGITPPTCCLAGTLNEDTEEVVKLLEKLESFQARVRQECSLSYRTEIASVDRLEGDQRKEAARQ